MAKKTDQQQSVFHDPAWPEGLYRVGDSRYVWRRKVGENTLKVTLKSITVEDSVKEAGILNATYIKPAETAASAIAGRDWKKKYALPAACVWIVVLFLILLLSLKRNSDQPVARNPVSQGNETPAAGSPTEPALPKQETPAPETAAQPSPVISEIDRRTPDSQASASEAIGESQNNVPSSAPVIAVDSENKEGNDSIGAETTISITGERAMAEDIARSDPSVTAVSAETKPNPDYNSPLPSESHAMDSACVPLTIISPDLSKRNIDLDALQRIKAATVYITLGKTGDAPQSSGSGFIAQLKDGVAIIATNQHVIAGDGESGRVITIVVHSGQPNEIVIKQVEIVAENKEDDIALLRVRSSGLPPAIDINCKIELIETLPVTVLGFPFGEALEIKKGNPAITISNASVSSLRYDERKSIAAVQLSGDVNPGNSGGPVVDSNGALVGITVAKVRDTSIGFAIPAAKLRVMMRGTLMAHEARLMASNEQKAELVFYASVCDPVGRIRRATLLLSPLSAGETLPEMKENRRVDKLLDPRFTISLSISGVEIAHRREFTNEADGASRRRMAYQFHYQLDTGEHFYTVPTEFNVVFSPTAVLYSSQPKTGAGGISRKGILKIDDFKFSAVFTERPVINSYIGGGNRFFILLLDDRRTLKVFDTTKEAFVNSITLPSENCYIAAGKSRFFVYDPTQQTIFSHPLPTGRSTAKKLTYKSPVSSERILGLSIGKNADTPLYVFGRYFMYLFETNGLTEVERYQISESYNSILNYHYRSSSDGRAVSHWTSYNRPIKNNPLNRSIKLYRYMEANGRDIKEGCFFGNTFDDVFDLILFGNKNNIYYTSAGIFDDNFNLLNYAGSSNGMAIPTETENLYLWMDSDGISIYENQDLYPTLVLPFLSDAAIVEPSGITIERRVVFDEKKEKIIILPTENDRLIIISFDLKKYRRDHKSVLLKPISLPSAKRGQRFRYTVSANSKAGKITYSLVGAPDDMTISDRRQITWQPPKDYVSSKCVFKLVISDETERQCSIRLTLDLTY